MPMNAGSDILINEGRIYKIVGHARFLIIAAAPRIRRPRIRSHCLVRSYAMSFTRPEPPDSRKSRRLLLVAISIAAAFPALTGWQLIETRRQGSGGAEPDTGPG